MARKSLADMVPDDLPEEIQIPSHPSEPQPAPATNTKTRARKAGGGRRGKRAAAETPPDDTAASAPEEDAEDRQSPPPRRARVRTASAESPGDNYPRRITLPLSESDYKALKMAAVEDDVNTVARLRAMVDLWQSNTRIREQIDRHARRLAR